jgi:PKD repeat protein
MTRDCAVSSLLAVAVAMTIGCDHQAASAPPLTGPSGFAQTIHVTATPDTLTQDGNSQSAIAVTVTDATGNPMAAVSLSLGMFVGTTQQNFGTLSARTVTTNSNGVANAVYTAPASSPVAGSVTQISQIMVTASANGPDGLASLNNTGSVTIHLVPLAISPATPTPSFTWAPLPVSLNIPVTFDASGSCPGLPVIPIPAPPALPVCQPSTSAAVASYAWTFGDGGTGSGKTVSHTFKALGTFSVTLTIVNSTGGTASLTQPVTIAVTTPPNAKFTFSPAAPGVNQPVNFNAGASAAGPGRTIASYGWDFGDGATGSGVTVTHNFPTVGTYTVTLTVTDDIGQVTTFSTSVTVVPALPTVIITTSPSAPIPGQPVNFNSDATTYYPGSGPARFAWTFGDGTPGSALANPTHVYAAIGTYSVGLSVTDTSGRTGVGSTTVSVVAVTPPTPPAPPVAAFSSSPATPHTPPAVVSFDATTSSTPSGAAINNYRWNFGDGTIVSGPPAGVPPGGGTFVTPNHTYMAVGSFTVTLTVTDTNNLSGSTTGTVTVGP